MQRFGQLMTVLFLFAIPFISMSSPGQKDPFSKAREQEAQALASNDSLLLGEAHNSYGLQYFVKGMFAEANEHYMKALRILEKLPPGFELVRTYVRLCDNEFSMRNTTEAFLYAQKARSLSEKINSEKGKLMAYSVLGRSFVHQWFEAEKKQKPSAAYDSTLHYYKRIEEKAIALADTEALAGHYASWGSLLVGEGDFTGMDYLAKSEALFKLWKSKVFVMIHMASGYLDQGMADNALEVLKSAESLVEENEPSDNYERELGLKYQYMRYYSLVGDWEKAFTYQQQFYELQGTRHITDRQGVISRLRLEFETEKKDELLRVTAEKSQAQQRFTMVSLLLLLVSAAMSIVFYRLSSGNKRISLQNAQLVIERNHRVKNTLHLVSSMLSLQTRQLEDPNARKAVEESRLRVQSLAIVHRRLYDMENMASIDIGPFFHELVSGILEAYGYGNAEIELNTDDFQLVTDKAMALGLVLNELTTNACKYAFPGNSNPRFRVECLLKEGNVLLKVTDNGPGIPPQYTANAGDVPGELADRESFGMQLIQSQVYQLYGSCHFNKRPQGGTEFVMQFKI